MWKKAILATGLVGALAVPAGVAVATTDTPTPVVARDRAAALECPPDRARDRARDQARDQTQQPLRIQDPAACECDGPNGPAGFGHGGPGNGHGAMDGAGPIHPAPTEGTGFRYGTGGR
ncbi:MAG TPA: hypothetical protein VE646_10735 [Actinomycetota bacterium]|jgi:hypothetical protein|nr:hypothetical protein [Actinomycetota bacterium]